ncbi:uncharacterized protein At5g65660-like [Primulina eburnea]|uniref:uncharacterized protein At5g65660-like n=1 Tax=Primulina eburnea TaxID=1245227 RepID=UPI003C6C7A0C
MEQGGAPVSHGSAGSRPSLGFPLGTALLLLVIFTLSGIFSCCYHWEKLRRTLSLRLSDLEADGDLASSKPKSPHDKLKQQGNQSMSVIMPGDNVPKFLAMPCPCEPPRRGENTVELQKTLPKAPAPLPRIAVPLY